MFLLIIHNYSQAETVGSFSSGIRAACWSPDHELLVLVTGELSLVTLIPSYESLDGRPSLQSLTEIFLEQEDFGERKFINVGWGKKETQFHGSEGKQAAKTAPPLLATTVGELDDRLPRVTWRGDGQLFAVSYVSELTESRKFRVLDRESVILYTGENVQGLEQSFSWRPSGNLIAASQKLSTKHNIIFFEKNGLQHGQFQIRYKSDKIVVKDLFWNLDSTVLLVWLEDLTAINDGCSFLQLWTMGNYHWYLKDEFKFDEKILRLFWDQDICYTLHVLTECGVVHEINFLFTVDKSLGEDETDLAQVFVIDGTELLLTPLRKVLIPPPVSAYKVLFPDQIHAIIPAPSTLNCNSFCIFHGQNSLTFFDFVCANISPNDNDNNAQIKIKYCSDNGFAVTVKAPQVMSHHKFSYPFNDNENYLYGRFYYWLWLDNNTILCCYTNEAGHYLLTFGKENNETINLKCVTSLTAPVTALTANFETATEVWVHFESGDFTLFHFDCDECNWARVDSKLPLTMPTLVQRPIVISLLNDDNKIMHLPLGLSTRNVVYLGSDKVLSDCTSFHLHNDHLLFTITSHSLLIVPLNLQILLSLKETKNENNGTRIGTRKIERGSRIVTAVACDTKVILQMPRGNIETISPRPLVIHTLKRLLNQKNYYEAVDIMRKNRIDMNLIFDHDPKEFLNNVELFVQNVDDPHRIDLFIANLADNSDVTRDVYAFNYYNKLHHDAKENGKLFDRKTDRIVTEIRNAMKKIDEEKFLLPILTTYVKSPNDEMHLALIKLKAMKESKRDYKVNFDEGLRHLLYVADANELCDVALGTYDFDLVMLVFEYSQKDPKEYLPFLNSLKKLEGEYKKYKINVHLQRYKKALSCITTFDQANEEYLELVKKQGLYLYAMEIFPKSSLLYKATCIVYGNHLYEKRYYNEAGAMYLRGDDQNNALIAFKACNNWRKTMSVAYQMKFEKLQIKDLCFELIENIQETASYNDIAILYEKYLCQYEEAIENYALASNWDEAVLLANKNDRQDLILTTVEPEMLRQFEQSKQSVLNLKSSFLAYFNRLIVVREIKFNQYLKNLECLNQEDYMEFGDDDTCSNISLKSGISSRYRSNVSKISEASSNKTYRSSKNRRKLDRKKLSTEEGSAFEDIGLVAALHELYVRIDGMTTEISDLNRALLFVVKDDKRPAELQDLMTGLIREIIRKKSTIWLNCSPNSEEENAEFDTDTATSLNNSVEQKKFIIQRMEELEPHYRLPPKLEHLSNWKLYSLK